MVDLGGYQGQWTSDIFAKYCCNVHIFEPVNSFASQIALRFSMNPKIKVHNFGLAGVTSRARISLLENCSSILIESQDYEEIQLVKATDFLAQEGIEKIDLLKINIEGGEYDLLDHLISTNTVLRIENIQVQFHDFFPDAKTRMQNIQASLANTHELTWQYSFIWENWKRKS